MNLKMKILWNGKPAFINFAIVDASEWEGFVLLLCDVRYHLSRSMLQDITITVRVELLSKGQTADESATDLMQ